MRLKLGPSSGEKERIFGGKAIERPPSNSSSSYESHFHWYSLLVCLVQQSAGEVAFFFHLSIGTKKLRHLRHPSPNENDEARARRCVGSLTLQTSTLKCGRGGGDEKFWVAWRFEDFQGQGMQTNTSVPKKNKKNQLAPAKKKDANTF